MIRKGGIKSGKIIRFMELNRWCTVIVYYMEKYKYRVLASSLLTFFDFLKCLELYDEVKLDDGLQTAIELLLPGAAVREKTSAPPSAQVENVQEIFERALNAAVTQENLAHFPVKGVWQRDLEGKAGGRYAGMGLFKPDEVL